jgi:hypothetical protein
MNCNVCGHNIQRHYYSEEFVGCDTILCECTNDIVSQLIADLAAALDAQKQAEEIRTAEKQILIAEIEKSTAALVAKERAERERDTIVAMWKRTVSPRYFAGKIDMWIEAEIKRVLGAKLKPPRHVAE